MPTDHRAALAKIKRFDQLVAYLRDEMGWPIARDSFEDVDDLFYDFTAEELGIDPKTAAKIESIKRLRPLSPRQPWGIFFIKFEPKRLPVVALRRILSQVALKKRASANSTERAAWSVNDLLFVSNYGEGDARQISFAHFSQAEARRDLPTLKVLGWDNLDTALHLDAVARELTQNLAWPDDEADIEGWRDRWRAAFTLRHREVVATSRELSIQLAKLARAIRDRIKTALAIETEAGPLTKLMTAFQQALVHDLDADGFADMYAQTIAYGLLSARIADPEKKTADDFAAHMRTNPLLRELMETFLHVGGRRGKAGGPGIDFDELGVSEVVELLDDANMEAVIRDFGDRNPQEDPVIHFYELFLKEYDAKKRVQRGVFYTPRPVVSYIVRSVDEVLRTEFGLEDGLADTATWAEMALRHKDLTIPDGVRPEQDFVQILDPATGTGTFLVEVIDTVHKTLTAKWRAQGHTERRIEALWNEYVPTHLLPRLHGYELLMAPYAIAHLKLGLKLYETGYRFGSDERARIYLTNALEPASDKQLSLDFLPALAHEAQGVNDVKRKQRFTAVIGNPPYSVNSANKNSPIDAQLAEYKKGLLGERNLKPLNDDYIKFIRFTHILLMQSGFGLLGMITNHSYTAARLFRAMRLSLLKDFRGVSFLDLRGDAGRDPTMAEDENVFDIQQGVGVSVLSLTPSNQAIARVAHKYELKGTREFKYSWLAHHSHNTTPWIIVDPQAPLYTFGEVKRDIKEEYDAFLPLNRAFVTGNVGYQTHRDDFVIGFTAEEVKSRISLFRAAAGDERLLSERFGLQSNRDWSVLQAHRALTQDVNWAARIQPTLYRPFDLRYIAYLPYLIDYDRSDLMQHLKRGNCGLLISKVFDEHEFTSVLATKWLVESKVADRTRGSHLFPLRIGATNKQLHMEIKDGNIWATNLSSEIIGSIEEALSFKVCVGDDKAIEGESISDEEVFFYIYSILNSGGYRSRYVEFLKEDFPRLPLPKRAELLLDLADLGGRLVRLHLLESSNVRGPTTTYVGPKNPKVGRVGWSDETVWLNAAATKKGQPATPGTIGFRGVPEAVWNFHIGGYQVCEKWLKDRRGRTLSDGDIAHYQKTVVAIDETIRLMREIDEVIEQYGGWPGAFALRAGDIAPAESDTDSELAPPTSDTPAPRGDQLRLANAAEPEAAPYEATDARVLGGARSDPHVIDPEDLICRVRQMFADGEERARTAAIHALARGLGDQRLDRRIQDALDAVLRAAVRRGILTNEGGTLRLFARHIEEYERGRLKEQFLGSLPGRAWIDRDEAIRGFARWMGFRRTGRSIDDTARSLINGLVRERRLERQGKLIRRLPGGAAAGP